MGLVDRQYIGVLADSGEANGKENVFLNKGLYIQYMVKSLLLPEEAEKFYTGYINSFEYDDEVTDDEYLDEYLRIENFRNAVKDKLFLFSCRPSTSLGEFQKIGKVNLIDKPVGFNNGTDFYTVPTFANADDEMIREWEDEKRWRLYREYNSLESFIEYIKSKKPVGSAYGYDASLFSPSFVIWKDTTGNLYAIGGITGVRYNTLGGIILDSDKIFKIDLTDYIKFIVYSPDVNPTVTFIPETIYKTIEDELLKASVSAEKTETIISPDKENQPIIETSDIIEDEEKSVVTKETIVEINKPGEEQLLEIDTSIKNDELIIQAMDYHSQRRNLFYSMKDFVNFHTAVKCNNLVILSGLSGTGKSALVDIYARALGINYNPNPEDNRLLFIPVRPSWNDDADLLGYVDLVHMVYRASDTGFVDFLVKAQKTENENKMFIVCFDEMNLARVEHYFSQFLSILERPVNQRELQLYDNQYSGRLYNSADYPNRIKIGDNIRFIGTVNVDETTYHFSDKVLDRANVIQLEVLNYSVEWIKKSYATLPQITWSYDDYRKIIRNIDGNVGNIVKLLWKIHQLLQSASSKYGVGPRIVKAVELYISNLPALEDGEFGYKIGVDYQIMQRVLTKVRGPESQIGDILNGDSENNIIAIFDEFRELSDFERCRAVVRQKQKELETYGYCI
jgi:hypothetical protein